MSSELARIVHVFRLGAGIWDIKCLVAACVSIRSCYDIRYMCGILELNNV